VGGSPATPVRQECGDQEAITLLSKQVGATPILAPTQQYYGRDTEPCTQSIGSQYQMLLCYHGTGVRPDVHPTRAQALAAHLQTTCCGQCDSPQVLVITLTWSMTYYSGSFYYNYEVVCQDCGNFTAFTYDEV
jgi:hypothetical protein